MGRGLVVWPYVAGLVCVLAEFSTLTWLFPAAVIVVLSERPGSLLEDIVVDIPGRSDPLARRLHPRANDYVKHLFDLMKLDERMA